MTAWTIRNFRLAACVIAAPNLAAAVLRGTVTDRTGALIQGASVQLFSAGRAVTETKTSANGEFSLVTPPGLRADETFTILAVAIGFAPTSQPVQLAQTGSRRITIEIDIAPYRQSVEIHASLPTNESLLDMSGVRESSAKDLGEALTALDGVWKIRKAGIANDLVIRGFQQNNINVLVDGSRTYRRSQNNEDRRISMQTWRTPLRFSGPLGAPL
jgi:hypothetical protein